MSHRLLVLVPSSDGPLRWRRVDAGGAVLAAGVLVGDDRLDDADDGSVTAIVPGADVALHWLELPAASIAQAAAAARLLAADIIAGPVADQHIAAAPAADADGHRAIAVVERARMDAWLAALARHGVDPDRMVPAPMLLPQPAEGVAMLRSGESVLVRGERLAAELEPALVDLVIGDGKRSAVTRDLLDLAAALPDGSVPLDLRQGDYRARRGLRLDRSRLRRLALLAAACLVAAVATPLALAVRNVVAAAEAEAETAAIVRRALGQGTFADPLAELNARRAARGAGSGFVAMSASLLGALEASGSIRIETLRYGTADGVRATLVVPSGASLDPVRARLAASGLKLVEGASRAGSDAARVDIEVTAA
jgi:general secretion pathway protein L